MRAKITAVAFSTILAAAFAAAPASAQSTKRVVSGQSTTQYVVRGEDGRTRTRVIVQPRSFLDAGTEVRPGERKFTDYVYPPNYSPTDVIDKTNAGSAGFPLPGPFDLPGKDNPYPWMPN